MSAQDLAGRTALVTGSTSGIGKATAIKLSERGARVLVAGRNEERGGAVMDAIRAAGGKAEFLAAALGNAASGRDLAQRALETAGGEIDILVNNAGTGFFASTAATTEEQWDRTFETNIKGHFFLVGALGPAMAAQGKGAIVNVSTMGSRFSIPGMAVYGATKSALNMLTKSWAAEFGTSGVRVNAVSPGTTRTPAVEIMGDGLNQLAAQSPLGYVAQPEQIADAIVYLASDEAGYITGAILNVDGGRTAV